MSTAGKGSRPRPISVTQQEYDSRWDAIFGKDLKDETSSQSVVKQDTSTANFNKSSDNPRYTLSDSKSR